MNFLKILILISLASVTFSNCKQQGKTDNSTTTLSVTNNPQKFFLEQIVGNRYTVNCVIPPGVNPEGMDLTPSQLLSLSRSVAYFKIGFLDVENILIEKIKSSNTDIKIFECSADIEIIKDAECNNAHGNDENHDHQHHGHANGDPHTWSSARNAKVIAHNMYKAMLELDKENEDFYKSNYEKLTNRIDSVDNVIKFYLENAESRTFIIYHPALSYFAKEYNLEQYSIEHEGKNPSPSQIKTLIDRAKKKATKVVFIQREFDAKNAQTIAMSIGARTVPIDLLSYDWDQEMIKIAKAITGIDE